MDAVGINSSITEFENIFETLDVKTEELNGAMDGVYSSAIDEGEVTNLLDEMKSGHQMGLENQMAGAGAGKVQQPGQAAPIDDMQAKLDNLKNM